VKRLFLAIPVLLAFALCGCSAFNDTLNGLNVVGQIVAVAQADLPALQAAGTFSAADETAAQNWLSGVASIQAQAVSCVNTIGSKGAKSAFAGCVTAIGTGLLSPTEMAQLRILSPKAQKQVTIWVTAVVLATNAVAAIVNAAPTVTPAIVLPPASTQELNEFKSRLNLDPAWGY
jgi:hypothetical protein